MTKLMKNKLESYRIGLQIKANTSLVSMWYIDTTG